MRNSSRAGLTLIELLVVVAVIGLLAGLISSAVGFARESARRAQCTANLAEFGRALSGYQSANGRFPPALLAVNNNPQIGSNLWYAPHVSLLPYVEQSALAPVSLQQPIAWQPQSPGLPVGASPGTMLPWTQLPIFRCPSDGYGTDAWARNSYRVCTGPGTSFSQGSLTIDGGLGAFIALQPQPPAAFIDGLSATVGAAEKRLGSGSTSYSRAVDFWYSGASSLGKLTPDQMAGYCGALSGAPAEHFAFGGATWFFAGYEDTWYNHVLPPNAITPDCSQDFMEPAQSPTSGGAFRASSQHPGGVNCMYMDGSVRFVVDSVALVVWRAVSTRAGGEAVTIAAD